VTWTARYEGGPLDGRTTRHERYPPPVVLAPVPLAWAAAEGPSLTFPTARYDLVAEARASGSVLYRCAAVVAGRRWVPCTCGCDRVLDLDTGRQVSLVEEQRRIRERILADHAGPLGRTVVVAADSYVGVDSYVDEVPSSSYRYGADAAAFDLAPDTCWRCDAAGAATDVGLCEPCRDDLRGRAQPPPQVADRTAGDFEVHPGTSGPS